MVGRTKSVFGIGGTLSQFDLVSGENGNYRMMALKVGRVRENVLREKGERTMRDG